MHKWANIQLIEQELIISICYCNDTTNIYTTRGIIGKKLEKILGTPHKIQIIDNLIHSYEWTIKNNRRSLLQRLISVSLFLKQKREDNDDE